MSKGLMAVAIVALTIGVGAQASPERQRARPVALAAEAFMRAEAWAEAAKLFQQAIDIDNEFEDAYYGLGLANVRMKNYAAAFPAYVKCRDLYRAMAGKTVRQPAGCTTLPAGSHHRDRRAHPPVSDRPSEHGQPGSLAAAAAAEERHPGFHLAREQHEHRELGALRSCTWRSGAHTFEPGSCQRRSRNTKPRIPQTPSPGEALNNLAVVYMQTGHYKEADDALKSAEKAG